MAILHIPITDKRINSLTRALFSLCIFLSISSYTYGVISGNIPKTQQIDAAHFGIISFALIVIVLLLRPKSLDRLKLLEMSGFKLEMLEEVQDKQAKQANMIDDIALMLPLLLPKTERKHLSNLDRGKTEKYLGNSRLRSEIRRLRSIGLLEMLPGKHVGQMADKKEFNLIHYVRLTSLGNRWVRRIKQIEKSETLED